uniref:PABP n=1 Tax=Daucus carota subsp. sativus TaxID=79200 RepID=A0A162A4R8_DAUCS
MAQIQAQPQPIPVTGANGVAPPAAAATTSLFVGDLDYNVTDSQLYDLFNQVGQVVSVRVCRDLSTGRSLGYGYVNYSNQQDGARALDVLNFTQLNNKTIRVMVSHRDPSKRRSGTANIFIKQDRETEISKTKFNNIYVKNLSETTTEEELREIFGEHGTITSVVVMRDGDGKSKCFGFVNFDNPEDAAKAVDALNGKKFDDKEWYVGKAQKKSEREVELKSRFEQSVKEQVDKFQGLNLYVKNLDETIDDEKLKELFSEFGTISSCKVMRDPSGISRGSGFVAFSTPEEASRALGEMNGKMIVSKPLYVALAQRKEDRRARLQAQFSQMRPVAMAPSMAPRMPMYPPGAPGMGQQLFYGQAPPAMISPQAGFGYQQQLVPGMRPGGGPMPNFYMPMVQQGQQGQRPGGRRGAGPAPQTQQPVPMMPQQLMPRGRMYRFPPGRNVGDVTMPGVGGSMLPVPYNMGGMLPRDSAMGQPMPITALASALANAPSDQQRTMLGENLYPLVDQLEHDHAAKVTGMLLEMDQTEVLHLLESPDALKAKVAEAMDVLRNVSQSNTADQLAGLSLNENLVS